MLELRPPPAHDYGLTIEERIDHISKQLDMIESGESGGGNPLFIVNSAWNDSIEKFRLDRTWQEIYDAFEAGKICVIKMVVFSDYQEDHLIEIINAISHIYPDGDNPAGYAVNQYYAGSPNDYPVQDGDH